MTDSFALYSARRGLGILGGTFDPVHAGHLCLARAALEAVPLVRVELMPAGEPWQKSRISPGIHRLNMLRIAVEYEPQCRINTSELCRNGATYTIDTVRRLREEVGPDMPLVLILGSDQWFNLSTWKDWQSLIDFVHIAFCARDGIRALELPDTQACWAAPRMTEAHKLVFQPSGNIARFEMPPHSASATAIRRTLAREPFVRAMTSLDGWLNPGVVTYIRQHGLYQSVRH